VGISKVDRQYQAQSPVPEFLYHKGLGLGRKIESAVTVHKWVRDDAKRVIFRRPDGLFQGRPIIITPTICRNQQGCFGKN
jgi:hypothetical protein